MHIAIEFARTNSRPITPLHRSVFLNKRTGEWARGGVLLSVICFQIFLVVLWQLFVVFSFSLLLSLLLSSYYCLFVFIQRNYNSNGWHCRIHKHRCARADIKNSQTLGFVCWLGGWLFWLHRSMVFFIWFTSTGTFYLSAFLFFFCQFHLLRYSQYNKFFQVHFFTISLRELSIFYTLHYILFMHAYCTWIVAEFSFPHKLPVNRKRYHFSLSLFVFLSYSSLCFILCYLTFSW